jgi:protein-S-isoprenylcysteine O-methyltransferase Ste14
LERELNKNLTRYYIQLLAFLLLNGILLFISSGIITWIWAWVYLLIFPVYTLINAFILPADLLAERGKRKTDLKKWDKNLTSLGMIPALITFIIAGLDERLGWTADKNLWFHLTGIVFYLLGNLVVTWSMYSNRYFSTMVRIQDDREHSVASGGAYKFVRHPGYVGILLNTLFTPVILGSLWALIPAFIVAGLFIVRTIFEDRTLHKELKGYPEFAHKVKYKLIPGIW